MTIKQAILKRLGKGELGFGFYIEVSWSFGSYGYYATRKQAIEENDGYKTADDLEVTITVYEKETSSFENEDAPPIYQSVTSDIKREAYFELYEALFGEVYEED